MTASSVVESKLRGRPPSEAPAEAAGLVLGVQPRDQASKARFSKAVHWSYGSGWGVVRGLLGLARLSPLEAAASHMGLVWGAELVMLPALKVSPPPWKWGVKELGVDGLHHAVYASATSLAYAALSAGPSR
jgi:hypothetical protein